jgi:hypothetical protein
MNHYLKKLLALGATAFLLLPLVAAAQTNTQSSNSSLTDTPLVSQSASLDNNTPQVNSDGTVSSGQNNPTTVTTGASSLNSGANSAAVTNCSSSDGFVSLSCIPGFAQAETSSGLTAFFNTVYQLCIGAAALIAVIQIIRAGILRMTAGGNASQVSQSNELIRMTLIGLLLVLSPVIVFSIINKSILSLSLNGLDNLNVTPSTTSLPNADTGAGQVSNIPCINGDCSNQMAACDASHPRTEICQKADGTADPNYTLSTAQEIGSTVGLTENLTCPSDEKLVLQCVATAINNPGQGTPGASSCNSPAGTESQSVSCGTDDAALAWNNQYCGGGGHVTKGVCTGGATSAGACISGQYAQVFCPGTSPQKWTFQYVNGQMKPAIPSEKSAIDAFVNSCAPAASAKALCFPYYQPPSSVSCPDGNTNETCYTSALLCTNTANVGNDCTNGYVLNDN